LAGKIYIIYRAMSMDNTSVLGLAVSGNGETIEERLPEPIYQPRYDFEMKKIIGGNSGCEDPRVSLIGSRIYLCYTAFNGVDPPRIALTSILVSDFVNRKWNWKRPTLISNPKGDNKDACIIPDKIADKYIFFHREGGEGMVMDTVDDLEFENNEWLTGQLCIPPRIKMWDSEKIGVAAPPLKTEKGWLLLYHGMSNRDYQYRVGAILLDLDDPSIVIGRSEYPLLEAKMNYEKNGDVPNVVFPCGAVIRGDKLLVYYGGGDKVVGVATGKVDEIMADLG